MLVAQSQEAKILVDDEEFYIRPLRDQDKEGVTKMLDEVHAKLRTEIKVAMYELDQRY